jgi:1-acyl-sn-glycerol-3-phosphate acyltransferase
VTTLDSDPKPAPRAASASSSAELPPPIVRRGWVYKLIMWLLVHPIYRVVYRVRIEGREHLPEGGALLAANHESFLDIPLVSRAAAPRHVAFVARDSLAKTRWLAFVMERCGAILLKRGASDRRALREMVAHLVDGDLVAVFPEGTRTRDGSLGPFKGGVLLAAKSAGVPVVPVGIVGSFEAWPRDRKLPGRGRLVARFGPSIPADAPDALARLRDAVGRLSTP